MFFLKIMNYYEVSVLVCFINKKKIDCYITNKYHLLSLHNNTIISTLQYLRTNQQDFYPFVKHNKDQNVKKCNSLTCYFKISPISGWRFRIRKAICKHRKCKFVIVRLFYVKNTSAEKKWQFLVSYNSIWILLHNKS